jgi:hypothetical protein
VTIFEQTLRDLLIHVNLVGPRVFLMRAPQAPAAKQMVPYVVFFPVAPIDPRATQTGPLSQVQRLYQVSIFDESQTRALAIADSFRQALDTLTGSFQEWHIGHCLYASQTWNWENDTQLFHVIQEYSIMFNFLGLAVTTAVTTAPKRNTIRNATRKET